MPPYSLSEKFDELYSLERDDRDTNFLKTYEDLEESNNLSSLEEAYERLYSDPFRKHMIEKLRETDLNCMIGGSTGLYCLYKSSSFEPSDIDLYIKHINKEKLVKVEEIINSWSETKFIVVVRLAITMTWYVIANDSSIHMIQVNLFDIGAWSEVFIAYHSNIVCSGYDITNDMFVWLKDRFNKTYDPTYVHKFSGYLSMDTSGTLSSSVQKYQDRGFACSQDYATYSYDEHDQKMKNCYKMDPIEGCSSNGVTYMIENGSNYIVDILIKKYSFLKNVCFSHTVDNIYLDNEIAPIYKYMSVFKMWDQVTPEFLEYLHKPKELFGSADISVECPNCGTIVALDTLIDGFRTMQTGTSLSTPICECDIVLDRYDISGESTCDMKQKLKPIVYFPEKELDEIEIEI